ncbi:MAG: hypothetical protein NTY07_12590 [Bacteroidia bacterium]|nr:hypothetical protein [Bacteroidia bacterium]
MKNTFLKICGFILLLILIGISCNKEAESTGFVEGYIVGSFVSELVNKETGQATGSKTPRGYCILLADSKNANTPWPMDFYAFELPGDPIVFPLNILSPLHDGSNCGPTFFPDNLRNSYNIRFQYHNSSDVEKIRFVNVCSAMNLAFPWENFRQITIMNIETSK